jgi:hypothetical protein
MPRTNTCSAAVAIRVAADDGFALFPIDGRVLCSNDEQLIVDPESVTRYMPVSYFSS